MVNSLTLDWVGRRLYIALTQNNDLTIKVLALDNRASLEEVVSKSVPPGTMVDTTLSPYVG